MKRRTVFRHLAVASAAAWILPSCIPDPKKVSLALNRLQISADDESLLGNIADVLIPETDTPGARSTQAHLFALVMVDDCMPKAEQEKYLKGMRNFEEAVRKLTGSSFASSSPTKREEILRVFQEKLETVEEEIKMFYTTTRGYIIQGYTSSQYFLTNVKPYKLVPGPNYRGCAPVLSTEQKSLS